MPDSKFSSPDIRRQRSGRPLLQTLVAGLVFGAMVGTNVQADNLITPDSWHGQWQAEGTDFALLVLPSGTNFRLEPLRPAGIIWQAGQGMINGNSGTVEVRYQGVVAQVLVQLTGPETAIARSMSCQPDFHVICTLVRNQQARFVKLQ